jgi:hypothetical protein
VTAVTSDQLDEIGSRARELHFWRTVLTIVASVLFAIGWIVARVWLALAWCMVAVKLGWQSGAQVTHGST